MKNAFFSMFIVLLGGLFFSSCGSGSKIAAAADNPMVQDFLARFSKEKFLEEFGKERDRYEGMVKIAKANGAATDDLQTKYRDAQEAFGKVLDDMATDIQGVKTIVGFKLIDNESRYRLALEDAKKVGGKFSTAIYAEKSLEGKVPYSVGIAAFAKMVIFPLISKVHDKYLQYCQSRMVEKINGYRFRDWGAI